MVDDCESVTVLAGATPFERVWLWRSSLLFRSPCGGFVGPPARLSLGSLLLELGPPLDAIGLGVVIAQRKPRLVGERKLALGNICVGSAEMGQTASLVKLETGNKNCEWIYRIWANPGKPRGGIVPPIPVLAPGSALGSRPRVALSSAQAPSL